MKYNIFGYLIGEGIGNIFKNKKSTGAAIIIMCATMLIFGFFLVISENINHFVLQIEEDQGMQVFVTSGTTQDQLDEIEDALRKMEGVSTVLFQSKEDALNIMKEKYNDNEELFADYEGENNIFTESFIITLTDLEYNSSVQEEIAKLDNIKKITSSDETVETLISIAKGIRVVTGGILAILVVISTFIISNTIKLTVHSRRKEISIMKYVGATNWFIRWPFIVEGIIIGLVSSIFSIGIVAGGYSIIAQKIIESEALVALDIELVTFSNMFNSIILVYMLLGIGIGVIGSITSMKKFLKV